MKLFSFLLILEHLDVALTQIAFRGFSQPQRENLNQQHITFDILAENYLNNLAFKTLLNKDFTPNEIDMRILHFLMRETEKRIAKTKQANSVYWLLRQG